MLPARRYTIFLEVGLAGGNPALCELTLTPIGFSNTIPASFWTQLLSNLAKRPQDMKQQEELDSLLRSLPSGLEF